MLFTNLCITWRWSKNTSDRQIFQHKRQARGSEPSWEDILREDMLAVNRSVLQPPSAHCREIHLTAIIRHGTRYPTTKDIKEMQQLHNNVLHNALGEERWLQEIKTQWTMWYTEDMDGRLVTDLGQAFRPSGCQSSSLRWFQGRSFAVDSSNSWPAPSTGVWTARCPSRRDWRGCGPSQVWPWWWWYFYLCGLIPLQPVSLSLPR